MGLDPVRLGPEVLVAARFCPHCGIELDRPARRETTSPVPKIELCIRREPRSFGNEVLRVLLAIWLVAYPVVACTPGIAGIAAGGTTGGFGVLASYLVGGLLWGPWIVGIIVLGLLILLTR